MSKKRLPTSLPTDQKEFLEQIQVLRKELEEIHKKIREFEALLRSHVSDMIVEAQELYILYNQIKKAKKANRLEQKKRGKNYKEPKGIQAITKKEKSVIPLEEQKEKKKLYREAMLHVHPDKFHLSEQETETATEITSKLIEIYKTGSLETLQAYHAHIFEGNTNIVLEDSASKIEVLSKDTYLLQEIDQLEKDIELAKNYHLYKVITEYENPLTFVEELKDYYEDKISKLKKRTRKGF